MLRVWRKAVDYSGRFTGAESGKKLRDSFVRQTATGWFEAGRLHSGTLVQRYRWNQAEIEVTLEGRFCGDRLLEGKKFLGGRLVQTKGFEENGEYVVVNYDALSRPVRRVRFDRDKRWRQTEYYHTGTLMGLKAYCPTVGRIVTRKPVPDGVLPLPGGFESPSAPFYELRDETGSLCYLGGCEGVLPQGGGSLFENQELRYAGAFRSGKRHGFGRSYLPCKEAADNPPPVLEYEGIFADDRYDGPGTLWLADGRTRYEGMFREGLLLFGKEWFGDRLIYEGAFLGVAPDGKFIRHGEGSLFHENGTLCFEGEFVDGMVHGEGVVRRADGRTVYAGKLCGGRPAADGVCYLPGGERLEISARLSGKSAEDGTVTLRHYDSGGRIRYSGGALLAFGSAENGFFSPTGYERHGWGVTYKSTGERFEGVYQHNERFGPGACYFADDQLKSRGMYEHDLLHGEGLEFSPEGRLLCRGRFEMGKCIDGEGAFSLKNGETYIGAIRSRRRVGFARILYPGGQLKYSGDFKDNYRAGFGTEYYENGQVKYSGSFEKGLYHGEGTLYDEDGRVHRHGLWRAGKPAQEESDAKSTPGVVQLAAQALR